MIFLLLDPDPAQCYGSNRIRIRNLLRVIFFPRKVDFDKEGLRAAGENDYHYFTFIIILQINSTC